jgi:hypothetical protein
LGNEQACGANGWTHPKPGSNGYCTRARLSDMGLSSRDHHPHIENLGNNGPAAPGG